MDKADVLDKVGNPARKSRQLGQDRWTYEQDTTSGDKEIIHVFFDEGKVTYVGPSETPTPGSSTKNPPATNTPKKGSFAPVGND